MFNENSQQIAELLERWERARESGQEVDLDALCPNNSRLRSDLKRRIDCLQVLRGFLSFDQVDAKSRSLPRFIGPYEVKQIVASNGAGIVCRCTQQSPQRDVAVKLLHPLQATGPALERFRLEAQILGLMKHSGIAQIFEAGITEVLDNPLPFIVMEFIDGVPLDNYVEQEQLQTSQRIELVVSVCEAMGHAHRQGVIHRDLKPANVLVTEDGHVKIVDFGIARITDAALRQSLVKHDTVGIVGSLAYTSPEQVTGQSDQLDQRTDVYSLGIVLYHLLTGEVPFQDDSKNYLELIRQICLERPARLGAYNPSYRGDLESIVAKAMEKDPKHRYESCDHLASDLRRLLRGNPVAARHINRFVRGWRWMQKNQTIAFTAIAVVLTLAISLAFSLHSSRVKSQALKNEALAFENLLQLEEQARRREAEAVELATIAQQQAEDMRRHAYNATLHEVRRIGDSAAPIAMSILMDEKQCPTEYRSLAWKLLRQSYDREPLQWNAGGQIFDLAFSPTGKMIASTSSNGQVRMWNAVEGELITPRRGILQRQAVLCFDPTGAILITATDQHRVRVWDCQVKNLRSEFSKHQSNITATAISADRTHIASADETGSIYLWRYPDAETVYHLRNEGPATVALRFLEPNQLVAVNVDGTLLRWDTETSALVNSFDFGTELTHAAISPFGSFIIVSQGRKHHTQVFSTSDGRPIKSIPLASRNYGAFSISDDESLVAFGSGGRIDIWATDSWEQVKRLEGHERKIIAVAFGPGGRKLASAGTEGKIKVQDTRTPDETWDSIQVGSRIHDIQRIPGTGLLIVGAAGGALIMNPENQQVVESIHCVPTIVTHVCAAHSGDRVAVQHGDRRIKIVSLRPDKESIVSPLFREKIRDLQFNQTGDNLYVATRDGPLQRWNCTDQKPSTIWEEAASGANHLAQNPCNGFLYVGTREGRVLFGNPDDQMPHILIDNSPERLTDIAVSHDGTRLAAAYRDGMVQLWDLVSHQLIEKLRRHTDVVLRLDFSPDSKTLLSAGRDGRIICWDAINGDFQVSLDCPTQSVHSVCVSETGDRVTIGTTENRISTLEANKH